MDMPLVSPTPVDVINSNHLFEIGEFTLHSGGKTNFRIDCSAFTDFELQVLAAYVATKIPSYGRVVGIPRGGIRFAEALTGWAKPGSGMVLIADDVYTTGTSIAQTRMEYPNSMGVVIFARGEPPWWVFAMFRADHLS